MYPIMDNHSSPNRTAVWAGMLSIYILWGSTYIANRLAVQTIPPFLMTGIRNLTAGAVLYGLRRFRGDAPPSAANWKSAILVGALMLGGGSGLVAWSQLTVPSGIAALIAGSVPLWMALLDILGGGKTRRHRPGIIAVLGIAAGFAGILVLIGPGRLVGLEDEINPAGAAALLFGAFFWAFGSLKSRGAVFPESRLLGSSMQMIGGGAGLLLIGTLTGEWAGFQPSRMSGASLLGFTYLVLFGSLVGFSVYTWLIRSAPTTLVSTYAYVNPLVAVFLGAVLLGETISLRVALASVVILVSVAAVTLSGVTATRPSAVSRPGSG